MSRQEFLVEMEIRKDSRRIVIMWSSWKKVLGAAAAALLGSALLLFAGFRGRGEQSIEKREGSRRIAKTSANKTLTLERDTKLMEAYGKVPLSFDENVGQTA